MLFCLVSKQQRGKKPTRERKKEKKTKQVMERKVKIILRGRRGMQRRFEQTVEGITKWSYEFLKGSDTEIPHLGGETLLSRYPPL